MQCLKYMWKNVSLLFITQYILLICAEVEPKFVELIPCRINTNDFTNQFPHLDEVESDARFVEALETDIDKKTENEPGNTLDFNTEATLMTSSYNEFDKNDNSKISEYLPNYFALSLAFGLQTMKTKLFSLMHNLTMFASDVLFTADSPSAKKFRENASAESEGVKQYTAVPAESDSNRRDSNRFLYVKSRIDAFCSKTLPTVFEFLKQIEFLEDRCSFLFERLSKFYSDPVRDAETDREGSRFLPEVHHEVVVSFRHIVEVLMKRAEAGTSGTTNYRNAVPGEQANRTLGSNVPLLEFSCCTVIGNFADMLTKSNSETAVQPEIANGENVQEEADSNSSSFHSFVRSSFIKAISGKRGIGCNIIKIGCRDGRDNLAD